MTGREHTEEETMAWVEALAAVPHPYQAKPEGMTLPVGCQWCGADRSAPAHRRTAGGRP